MSVRAALLVLIAATAVPGCSEPGHPEVHIRDIHGLALDPDDPRRLFVATHHGLFLGESDTRWTAVTREPFDMMGFTMHPGDARIMYASGHPNRAGQGWAVGVVRSTDGGATWTTLGLQNQVDFHAMAMRAGDALATHSIYGFHAGKLYASTDGGSTWTNQAVAFSIASLAVHPVTGDLWAASVDGLRRAQDATPMGWEVVTPGPSYAVAIGPGGASLYAYFAQGGLARSQDDGKTWTRLNWTVASGDAPWGIAAGPEASGLLYAGTARGSIHKTSDGGATWTRIK